MSLTYSELEEMRNRILSQDKCSDVDLEKLVLINEKLGDKPVNFDKLKGWQWLGLGIVSGLLLHGFLTRPQTQPNTFSAPANSGAPVIYNIDNN